MRGALLAMFLAAACGPHGGSAPPPSLPHNEGAQGGAGPQREPVPVADDRDGDGVEDAGDKCMDDPEDFDGFQDEDGCPDPDNDADGILDADDQCPNDPENRNGFQDDDGCPDRH